MKFLAYHQLRRRRRNAAGGTSMATSAANARNLWLRGRARREAGNVGVMRSDMVSHLSSHHRNRR